MAFCTGLEWIFPTFSPNFSNVNSFHRHNRICTLRNSRLTGVRMFQLETASLILSLAPSSTPESGNKASIELAFLLALPQNPAQM